MIKEDYEDFMSIKISIIMIITIVNIVFSQTTETIHIQGYLQDVAKMDQPVNGTYKLKFNLYLDSMTEESIWTETQEVKVVRGLYQAEMGLISSFKNASLLFDQDYYFDIEFGDGEKSSRQKFSYSPYSISSKNLTGRILKGTTVDNDILVTSVNGLKNNVMIKGVNGIKVDTESNEIVIDFNKDLFPEGPKGEKGDTGHGLKIDGLCDESYRINSAKPANLYTCIDPNTSNMYLYLSTQNVYLALGSVAIPDSVSYWGQAWDHTLIDSLHFSSAQKKLIAEQTANAINDGILSSKDWNSFNFASAQSLINKNEITAIYNVIGAENRIDSKMIKDGEIDSVDLKSESVTSSKIKDGSIQLVDLASNLIITEVKAKDGVGSGLDADLLDGKTSVEFAASSHGHDAAYVNVNEPNSISSGMIISGAVDSIGLKSEAVTSSRIKDGSIQLVDLSSNLIMTEVKAKDGVGSGLDADLLDGKTSSEFATSIHNHDGAYINVNEPNSINSGMIADGSIQLADLASNLIITEVKSKDGVGSGLDADLLDGKTSTEFATSIHNHDGAYINVNEPNSINSGMIADEQVTSADLQKDAVYKSLLDDERMKVLTGTTPESGISFTIPFPDGFDPYNSIVLSADLVTMTSGAFERTNLGSFVKIISTRGPRGYYLDLSSMTPNPGFNFGNAEYRLVILKISAP